MLKAVTAIGVVVAVLAMAIGAFLTLKTMLCSPSGPLLKLESQVSQSGTNDDAKNANPGQQNAAPQGQQPKPSASFNLRITEHNKIEGTYYAENREGHKSDWSHQFLCETEIGEFLIAIFTILLAVFTGLLWRSTDELTSHIPKVERAYISGGGIQGRIEGMEVFEFHINNYGKTPGTLLRLGFGFCDGISNLPTTPQYSFEPLRLPINPGLRGHPIWIEPTPANSGEPIVYGRFYFETIFGSHHSAGFIYRLIGVGVTPRPVANVPDAYTEDRDGKH